MERINSPWTAEQVAGLNAYQRSRQGHPFTCGSGDRMDSAHCAAKDKLNLSDWGALIATPEGWICPACAYTQNWAYDSMMVPKAVGWRKQTPRGGV